MDTRDLLTSGNLELYVCGLLPDEEAKRITAMARENTQLNDEIVQIERAMIELSSAFAPPLSLWVYQSIAGTSIPQKPGENAVRNPGVNWAAWSGWLASIIFLVGAAYLFKELDERNEHLADIKDKQDSLTEELSTLENKSISQMGALAVVRDSATMVVRLSGQPISPDSYTRVYWNKITNDITIDAQGLVPPPQGMAYQVWALNYKPFLPVSIGLLEDFEANSIRMFGMAQTARADAFAITLEPVGGSASPTLEQIIVLGKI